MEKSKPTLLGLPGELRNKIYRFVLITSNPHHHIIVKPENHDQPALLRTNRQIRNEATPIFEYENHFSLQVRHLKPVLPQQNHWIHHDVPFCYYEFHRAGKNNWNNLKGWLEASFRGQILEVDECDTLVTRDRDVDIVIKAFEILRALGGTDQFVSWSVAEAVLEVWKETVAIVDPDFWDKTGG